MRLIKLKILVVDSSNTIHKLYKRLLPSIFKNEVTIIEAKDGNEAFDMIEKYHGIDMVFTEVDLPHMSGVEFIQRVRDIHSYNHIRIFVATTNFDKNTLQKLKSYGINGYIKKPLADKKVIRRIKSEIETIPSVELNETIPQEEIKVMVVDDSKTARKLVKLEAEGIIDESLIFIEAEDGAEAIKLLEASPDIELMFLDINMPNMKGDEALKKIKSNHKYANLKIIMVTTESDINLVKSCIAIGANGYIVKPLDSKKVYNSLSKALGMFDSIKIRALD
jgi:two-component system chemotaxis response regulator CheY